MKYSFVCLTCSHQFSELMTETKHRRGLRCPNCGSKFVEQNFTVGFGVAANEPACGSGTFCEECGLCNRAQSTGDRAQGTEHRGQSTGDRAQINLANQSNQNSEAHISVAKEAPFPPPPMEEYFTMPLPQPKPKKIVKIKVKKVVKKKKAKK